MISTMHVLRFFDYLKLKVVQLNLCKDREEMFKAITKNIKWSHSERFKKLKNCRPIEYRTAVWA
ncbi:IS3 family transposase [Priestia megaterium]|nr:IS3 family transposase [Priestia megaterium]